MLVKYLDFAEGYYRRPDGTHTNELHNLKDAMACLKACFASLPASEFLPKCLTTVRQHMIDKGWTRRNINKQVGRVRRIFKWGVENELVPPSVSHGLHDVQPLRRGRCEARETEPIEPVPDSVVDATLPHLNPVVRAMVEVQRLCGCRPGEVCKMRACEIDRSGRVWIYSPADHKTAHHGHKRRIYLRPKAQAILQPFIDAHKPDEFLFQPREAVEAVREARTAARKTPKSCGNNVGSNRKARPKRKPGIMYETHAYGHAIDKACRKAKVPCWSPNQLRHAAGTQMRREHGLEVAQLFLGHARANITETYAERDEDRIVELLAKMG